MILYVVIIAALIIIPLYATGTIHPTEYNEVPLVAPPPLAPPPAPAAGAVAPHITHSKGEVELQLAQIDGVYGDSEERFRRLGECRRSSS